MRREVRPYGAFSLLPDLNIVPQSDQKTHEALDRISAEMASRHR
jgi:hypothetical protein